MQGASSQPVDLTVLAELRDLGPDDFSELISMFLEEATGRVARLRAMQCDGNAIEMARIAHTLKGASGAFGALALSALCAQIEVTPADTSLGSRHGFSRSGELVEAVAQEFERVRDVLTEQLP